jgi:hypothetical protein
MAPPASVVVQLMKWHCEKRAQEVPFAKEFVQIRPEYTGHVDTTMERKRKKREILFKTIGGQGTGQVRRGQNRDSIIVDGINQPPRSDFC